MTGLLQGYKNGRAGIHVNGTEIWTVSVALVTACNNSIHECEMFWIWQYLFIYRLLSDIVSKSCLQGWMNELMTVDIRRTDVD